MAAVDAAACPACGAGLLPDQRYCEACGAERPAPPCLSCGATDEAVDGYCTHCGARVPRPRDHTEVEAHGAAGVTDRGRRHHRNEDAMALDTDSAAAVLVVVCDGVSTTERPDEASQAAVDAAIDVLRADPRPDSLAAAYDAARAAVLSVPASGAEGLGVPSCTYLAAVVTDTDATVANLGDCRAYWLGTDGPVTVTVDDSWATEEVVAGRMTVADAYADPRAHTITRWLGADADPAWTPRIERFVVPGPGRLILCSDGLWNYALDGGAVAEAMGDAASPLDAARRLTDAANDAGGHDNITVVVVDLPRPPDPSVTHDERATA